MAAVLRGRPDPRIKRSVTLPSPRIPMMKTAGRMARSRVISRRTHGRMRQRMNLFHDDLPGQCPGDCAALSAREQGDAKQRAGEGRTGSGASVK